MLMDLFFPSNTIGLKPVRQQLSSPLPSALLPNCRDKPQPNARVLSNPSKCEEIWRQKRGLLAELSRRKTLTSSSAAPSTPDAFSPLAQQVTAFSEMLRTGGEEGRKEGQTCNAGH